MNFERLTSFLDGLPEIGIAGSDCAVYLHGDPVFRHMSGYQDIEHGIRINEHTLYRMYSMTKPITCAAALQMLEQGVYLLTDLVSDYLPEFASTQIRTFRPDGIADVYPPRVPLRLSHLFSMTSGLNYDLETPALHRAFEKREGGYTTREFAAALAEGYLCFEPGTHFYYGLSHDVIGALIEVWSGESFQEYLNHHLFEPLGIQTGWFREPEQEKSRLCGLYGLDENRNFVLADGENVMQHGDYFCSGGAGLVMTLDDYARFAVAMTNRGLCPKTGVRILNGRTVDMMRTPRLGEEALRDFEAANDLRFGNSYGLGVRTMTRPADAGLLASPGTFGWGGMRGTYVSMDPASGVTVVFAEQGVDTQSIYIQRRILNLAYAALDAAGKI